MSHKDGDQRRQMEAWQSTNQSLGDGPQTNNGAANGGGGRLILLKSVICNHVNITSVVSETCWPPLNSEKVMHALQV